nr:restriction endonuclease subunit S [Bifidobacterium longum]
MMTEQAKVPAIRFAGFTDPWEQRKLGDIAERVTRKNENNESDLPLTISAQHGLIDQRLFFNAQVASRDMSGYYLLRQGEFAYNKSTSADSPWGAIKRLTRYEKGCVSTLYICFALLNANPDYLVTYYETNRWHKAVQMIAAEGARNHGLLNIAPDDFFDTMVSLPESQAEQQTIGAFFSRLDSLITLHQRKYDKLVIFKKSMLEKMFPKDGESVPEIRFAGFTDPWEQRKLGEIVSIGAGAPPSAFSAGNFLYVKVDDLNESSHFQFDSAQRVDANTAVKPIRKGSIIFAKRGAAILGNKVRVLGKTAYIDTNMMALEPRGVDADFLWLFINQTGLYRIADTSTIPQINNKHIEPYPVDIPNMAEQQAIGTFFSRLDDLITLHQRKLELLQDIKKSLLDKMFV